LLTTPRRSEALKEEQVRKHLSYANAAATLALVLAIAGGSTAIAVTVNASKKSDVNKKGKIRAGRISAPKLASIRLESKAFPDAGTAPGEVSLGCQPGERLITGGASVPPGVDPATATQNKLLSSHPGPNNTWMASYETNVSPHPPLTLYIACLAAR
jgi:hypothetical protein